MRPFTPRQLALLAAAVATGVVVLGSVILFFIPSIDSAVHVILLAAVVFGSTYAFLVFGLERFIQERIRAIYKAVQGGRSSKSDAGKKFDMDSDVLGEVNSEMLDWVAARRTEIKELRERERFRREFIGNLAHELKTPIFNIQGYILTLLEGGLEDAKVNRDFLKRAGNGVERLTKIVEDLDMITKLESGIMELRLTKVDLHAVVEEAMSDVENQAKDKGIRSENKVPLGTWVKADSDRLSHVFTNLFVNAINYGQKGGFCRVQVDELDDSVLVEVSDNGIGISKEHLPRLFERFYRVGSSRSRNEGGSGLGLAIVKHIVDAHNGTITVKSEEGEGTVFVFTLKRAR